MDDNFSNEELLQYNRKLKQAVLDVLFSHCDTFYIHALPNPLLVIGKRGLVDKEKEDGIILAFGPYSTRHLRWDEKGITCEMSFSVWEEVHIPYESIIRMFDKSGQVIMQWITLTESELTQTKSSLKRTRPKSKKSGKKSSSDKGSVIQVDFSQKRRQED